jgi:hypothetical protein
LDRNSIHGYHIDPKSEPLPKRRAVLKMARVVHDAGAIPEMIAGVLGSRFLGVDGSLNGAALEGAFISAYPKADTRRWFFDEPIHHEGRTWIVSIQSGKTAEPALAGLSALCPEAGISYTPA